MTEPGTGLRSYRVASVQAAPVFLDLEGTVEKACRLAGEAASNGASLVVFPETWVPCYPVWAAATARWNYPPAKRVFRRLHDNSVDIPGPATERLGEAARESGVFIAIGVNERTPSGTLYNSIVFIGRDGRLLGKHRKLVPTYHERLIWGQGDGSTLQVFDTDLGRIGGLVCWEHWMPLARYALYTQFEQVHVSLWPTAGESFQLACRHMAFEGRVFVIVSCSYVTKEHLPEDFELAAEMEPLPHVLSQGGSAIIGPDGKYLVEPVYGREDILYADIDLGRIIEEKQSLDVVGHYGRPEVLGLHFNRREMSPLVADDGAAAAES